MKVLTRVIAVVCCMVFMMASASAAQAGLEGIAEEPSAEAADRPPLMSSRSWSASDVTKIELNYAKGEFITIEPAADGKITLNEYLTEDNAGYYAAAALSGGKLNFTQGSRPSGHACNSHTVLLLPESYAGTVSVHSGGGSISLYRMTGGAAYDLSCALGQIRVGHVAAKTIKASCPRAGTLIITDTSAALDVDFSGKITVSNSAVSGSIKNSGQSTHMAITLSYLSGDLFVSSASGTVVLGLPAEEAFTLNGTVTKTGGSRIVNHFGRGSFTTAGSAITGSNGSHPDKTVTVAASGKFILEAVQTPGNLKITAENANVDVQLAADGQYGYDYDYDKDAYTVTAAANGSTFEIKVAAKPGVTSGWDNRVTVRIPNQDYALITGVCEKGGLSLPQVNADINAANHAGALSVKLPANFTKTVNYTGNSGSGSLAMNGATDFSVSAAFTSSAVAFPRGWPVCRNGSSTYSFTDGSGTAKINIDLTNCAFALANNP